MGHLLYLIFRCDFDVMENLESLWEVNTATLPEHKKQRFMSEIGTSKQNGKDT